MKLPLVAFTLIVILVPVTDALAHEVGFIGVRSWNPMVEPSNESPKKRQENEVVQGWLCYSGRTGSLQSDCKVSFELKPGSNPVDIPGINAECELDAFGRVKPNTCGHGGHTHADPVRPVTLENSPVRYQGDADGVDLTITNAPSGTDPSTSEISWTAPNNGGVFEFESTLVPPDNSHFVSFGNGILFLMDEIQAIGRLNVTFGRDGLKQLPFNPQLYNQIRGGDSLHPDELSYAAQFLTQLALPAIASFFLDSTGSKISYNDISLPKGGIFDFKAVDFTSPIIHKPWKPPHASHRTGLDVDVNKPGGQRCDNNTSVLAAVSRFLEHTPENPAPPTSTTFRSALFCETKANNFPEDEGNYHIRVTRLRLVPFFAEFVL